MPAGVRGFRILEQLKYSEKALRQELARPTAGWPEILVRGVDVDPAVLRPRLKLRGSVSLSVVLTRIGRTPVAFVLRRGRQGSSGDEQLADQGRGDDLAVGADRRADA